MHCHEPTSRGEQYNHDPAKLFAIPIWPNLVLHLAGELKSGGAEVGDVRRPVAALDGAIRFACSQWPFEQAEQSLEPKSTADSQRHTVGTVVCIEPIGSGVADRLCEFGVSTCSVDLSMAECSVVEDGPKKVGSPEAKALAVQLLTEARVKLGDEAPSLIVLCPGIERFISSAAVLEDLGRAIDEFGWGDVPWLIGSVDPDYFQQGQRTGPSTSIPCLLKANGSLAMAADPADWEELFSELGFALLEQRPMHPESLGAAWGPLCDQHRTLVSPLLGRTKPRFGPVYLWLAVRRAGALQVEGGGLKFGDLTDVSFNRRKIAANQTVEILGNLGNQIYNLIEGDVRYKSEALGHTIEFKPSKMFGQMEISGNYLASRLLGTLSTQSDSVIESISSRQFREKIQQSEDVGHEMFLSMMSHMDDSRFLDLVSAQRVSKNLSRVIKGVGINADWVRNYSSTVLHFATQQTKYRRQPFRSRIIVEISSKDILELVYGDNGRTDNWLSVAPILVKSGAIDCFSPRLISRFDRERDIREDPRFEDSIDELSTANPLESSPLHLGWMAAQQIINYGLSTQIGGYDPNADHAAELALAIGSMLGSEEDGREFASAWKASLAVDVMLPRSSRGPMRPMRPTTSEQFKDWVLQLWIRNGGDDISLDKIRFFLDLLCEHLNLGGKNNRFADNYGLSSLLVIQDVWALLACALDEPDIWSCNASSKRPLAYFSDPGNRARIQDYFSLCCDHLAWKSGLRSISFN